MITQMTTMNNKAIILINFSMNIVSKYKDEVTSNEDLIKLEKENYCKKCDSIEGIKVYKWIEENTYVSPDDLKGNFILIFNPFGGFLSLNHIV